MHKINTKKKNFHLLSSGSSVAIKKKKNLQAKENGYNAKE